MPSKTLIRAAEARHRARSNPFDGLETSAGEVDFAALIAQKDALVRELRQAKYLDVLNAYPSESLRADQLLVATGRRPNTEGLGLAEVGIELGERGEVRVDEHLRTTRSGVFAAGDVTGEPAFVYVAAAAGNLAADVAVNGSRRRHDTELVPGVTFTDPAVATVGLTEARAREAGIDVVVSKLPMKYVPRAIAARDTRGFIKLVANRETKLLVGAQILAPEAGELIQQAVIAMRFGIRTDQLASLLYPYLTAAEGFKLACQTFGKDVSKLSCCAA